MPRNEGQDPDGSGGINHQFVDKRGRAGVDALTETDLEQAVERGEAYMFHSTYSATGAEEVWYLKNDGRDLHLDRLTVSTSASGIFQVGRQTSGTATGTTMEGRNRKLGTAILDDVTAFGDASVAGTVDGEIIEGHDIGTSVPFTFVMDGLIIPKGEAIFVRAVTTGIVHVAGAVHIG